MSDDKYPDEGQLFEVLNFYGYPHGVKGELLDEIQSMLWSGDEPALVQEKLDTLRAEITGEQMEKVTT